VFVNNCTNYFAHEYTSGKNDVMVLYFFVVFTRDSMQCFARHNYRRIIEASVCVSVTLCSLPKRHKETKFNSCRCKGFLSNYNCEI